MAYIGNRVVTGVGSVLKVDKSAPVNALRVKEDGKIGIGKADPTVELDVAGTVKATAFQGDGSALTGIESLPGAIDVNGSAPADSLAIDASGKVGIGTTSPSYLLHVYKSSGSVVSGVTSAGSTGSDVASSNTYAGSYYAQQVIYGNGTSYHATNATAHIIGVTSGTGTVRLYSGGSEAIRIENDQTVRPSANGTQDLGTSSYRWANIYTSDLHLSNGIGDYTVVEGEEDLFLYNNKNGKTYKFMLAEVDPKDAPKKMEK